MKIVVVLLAAGCTTVPTSSISAEFDARLVDSKLQVRAFFYEADYETELVLDDDARVVVTFRGRDVTLEDYRLALIDLAAPLVIDEPITFALIREGEGEGPATTITVPPPLEVGEVPLFVSRSKDLPLTWSLVSDDAMGWRIEGDCARGADEIPPGIASFTVAANSVEATGGGTCTAEFRLERWRETRVNPAFAAGIAWFAYQFSVPIASTP